MDKRSSKVVLSVLAVVIMAALAFESGASFLTKAGIVTSLPGSNTNQVPKPAVLLNFADNNSTVLAPYTLPQASRKVFSFNLTNKGATAQKVTSLSPTIKTTCVSKPQYSQQCFIGYSVFQCKLEGGPVGSTNITNTYATKDVTAYNTVQPDMKVTFDTSGVQTGTTALTLQPSQQVKIDMVCDLSKFQTTDNWISATFGLAAPSDLTYAVVKHYPYPFPSPTYNVKGSNTTVTGLQTPIYGPTFKN